MLTVREGSKTLWRRRVIERVEERDNMLSTRVGGVGSHNLSQEFDLVPRGFGIPPSRFDDLEGGMAV